MNLILCMICLLTSQLVMANNENNPGLKVLAYSGLNMRTVPGSHGQFIKTLSLGTEVVKVNDENSLGYPERIDWIDGEWILVEHEGDIGYVFDGFLTSLSIPDEVDEFTCGEMDLSYPMEKYFENNFKVQAAPDTIYGSTTIAVSQSSTEGHLFKEKDKPYQFETSLELTGVDIMEAYHLAYNMLSSKPEMISFLNNSTFVEDEIGRIRRIKVHSDYPVYIKRTPNQTVVITVISHKGGCTI